jgi:hypothetical protein
MNKRNDKTSFKTFWEKNKNKYWLKYNYDNRTQKNMTLKQWAKKYWN